MVIHSFIKIGLELTPVQVELTLMRGVPQWQILGLPDQTVKDGIWRIKTALEAQGFKLPTAQRVVIQVRPLEQRKSGVGLDFAIALALLVETGQIHWPSEISRNVFVFGELALNGQLQVPAEIKHLSARSPQMELWTASGAPQVAEKQWMSSSLQDLAHPQAQNGSRQLHLPERPPLPEIQLTEQAADLLAMTAAGEHSVLLAGPAGSGKSTWAELLNCVLNPPSHEQFRTSLRYAMMYGESLKWRPLEVPHHTCTHVALLGGGRPPVPGAVTRAHGGVLVLDELLEFHPRALEALREPLANGRIQVSRYGQVVTYPADFILVATSNLCRCGEFVPQAYHKCRCRLTERRRYLERLTGPLADRFTMMSWTQGWTRQGTVPLSSVLERIERATEFRVSQRHQTRANQRLEMKQLSEDCEPFLLKHLMPETGRSLRRRLALLRVARTLADLEEIKEIRESHVEGSRKLCLQPFQDLQAQI